MISEVVESSFLDILTTQRCSFEQSALVDPTSSQQVDNHLECCFATTRADAAKQSFFSFSSLLKNNN